jgi:N-acyl amino acid synthase of PEP-CTERM/exosortase system
METMGNFEFIHAESEYLKKAIYQLRYEVYVEEYGFERVEDHPSGYETDEYDPYSIHFAALNGNNNVIGTIRLVLHSDKGFPIEHAVKDMAFIGEKPEPNRIAEISRLAVKTDYRRRQEDGLYGIESYLLNSEGGIDGSIPQEHQRRKRPVIVLGLCRVLYHASKKIGLTHWYFISEKGLFYMLRKYGFLFHQIGEPVSYHGLRIPYLGIVSEIEHHLIANKPDVLQLMLMGLEEQYHPKL